MPGHTQKEDVLLAVADIHDRLETAEQQVGQLRDQRSAAIWDAHQAGYTAPQIAAAFGVDAQGKPRVSVSTVQQAITFHRRASRLRN